MKCGSIDGSVGQGRRLCAAVGDVVSADVVAELFETVLVAFVDDFSKLV